MTKCTIFMCRGVWVGERCGMQKVCVSGKIFSDVYSNNTCDISLFGLDALKYRAVE